METARHDKLFFFHNPKAGGSSVKSFLEQLSGGDHRCPLIENSMRDHEGMAGRYGRFRNYRFYSGHYGYDIYRQVQNGHAPVTNFRQPAARLLSLYNYFRLEVAIPSDPVPRDNFYPVEFAQAESFDAFVSDTDPRIDVHTRNHHVRQLTQSAWDADCVGDLAHATALIDRMPWYYVCEYPGLSAWWAHAVFGPRAGPIPRENVTSDRRNGRSAVTSVDEATLRTINAKNQLDAALHERATRRLFALAHQASFRGPTGCVNDNAPKGAFQNAAD